MSQQFFAPIVGETVRSDSGGGNGGGDWVNGRWQPGSRAGRASLHDVHLRPTAVQEEAPAAPVEVPQHYAPTYDAPQQASNFTQGGNMAGLATYEEMPGLDDENFDPYDPAQMNALIERRVQAALAPSRQAQSEAALAAQYNRCVEQYADDGNFKQVMDQVLEACVRDAQRGLPIDIEARYSEISDATSRRPGQRTAHLPSKAKTIKGLGALIDFNHKSGRAKPYRGR